MAEWRSLVWHTGQRPAAECHVNFNNELSVCINDAKSTDYVRIMLHTVKIMPTMKGPSAAGHFISINFLPNVRKSDPEAFTRNSIAYRCLYFLPTSMCRWSPCLVHTAEGPWYLQHRRVRPGVGETYRCVGPVWHDQTGTFE